MDLIANCFEDQGHSLWGCLKRSHPIQSFKDGDKFVFKKLFTFADHLCPSLKPVYFKLVLFDEDIHFIKLKKNSYYMISDYIAESSSCFKVSQNSFIVEIK